MEIESGTDCYEVGKQVLETDVFRLYLCVQESTGRKCLLQVAKEKDQNGALERVSYLLELLTSRSIELEEEYQTLEPGKTLNYELGFPELVDSFIFHEEGDRRINVLAFRNVEEPSNLSPLVTFIEVDLLRVDLRTSAWMMGKLLKLLVFLHSEGIETKDLTEANVLIEPDQHYVVIFDWADAIIHSGGLSSEIARTEIMQAATTVITALGGDPKTGEFPHDDDEGFARYTEHLTRLARGETRNAARAHEEFYALVDELWEREFHQFTYFPRS